MPLVLSGCLARTVVEPELPRGPVDVSRGQIVVRHGRAGFVIGAPHGATDPQTGEIAAELARRTGFGLVIASGHALDPDTRLGPGWRFQVTRISESAPGRPPTPDVSTEAAQQIVQTYERRLEEAAQGRIVFYAEIHGNARRESAGRIEVATVGVDRELGQRLRTLFTLVRDAYLRGQTSAPRLDMVVEPADRVFYAASSARRDGAQRPPTRALHLELPRAARVDAREPYLSILTEFLAQAATVPAGR